MKSDSSVYPDWARWIAMDKDGQWWCYEAEPHQHDTGWYENEVGRSARLALKSLGQDWHYSLQKIISPDF